MARKNPGFSRHKPGSGGRFKKCVEEMSGRPKVTDPKALCATIGARKYGRKQMGKWARAGRTGNPAGNITVRYLEKIKDALDRPRPGWYILERGVPSGRYDTKEQAEREAAALRKIRYVSNPMPSFPNVRLSRRKAGGGIEVGGQWYVGTEEWPRSPKADYIRKTLAEYRAEEPKAGWRLEFRGEAGIWHAEDSVSNPQVVHRTLQGAGGGEPVYEVDFGDGPQRIRSQDKVEFLNPAANPRGRGRPGSRRYSRYGDSPAPMAPADYARREGERAGEASRHHDQAGYNFIRESFRKWLHLNADTPDERRELEKAWSDGYKEGAASGLPNPGNPSNPGRLRGFRLYSIPDRHYYGGLFRTPKDVDDYAVWIGLGPTQYRVEPGTGDWYDRHSNPDSPEPEQVHIPGPIRDLAALPQLALYYTRAEAASAARSIGWPVSSARRLSLPLGRTRWVIGDEHGNVLTEAGYKELLRLRREYGPRGERGARGPRRANPETGGPGGQDWPTTSGYVVVASFGGRIISRHPLLTEANRAAVEASRKEPVDLWTTRGGHFGKGKPVAHFHKGKRTLRNPESESGSGPGADLDPAASDLYRKFHGQDPDSVITYNIPESYPSDLAELGTLVELVIRTVSGLEATLSFNGDSPKLASTGDGKQLYILGGDQSLDLDKLKLSGEKWERDSMVVGVLDELTYKTAKDFHSFKLTEYYHELGEETGYQPFLVYDRLNSKLHVTGGQYEVKREGIIN